MLESTCRRCGKYIQLKHDGGLWRNDDPTWPEVCSFLGTGLPEVHEPNELRVIE